MNPAILIDRYVPETSIRLAAKVYQIPHSEKTKPEIITAIVEKIGEEQAWNLLDEQFEVGRSAVYWFSPHGVDSLTRDSVQEQLEDCGGNNLFDYAAIPDLDSTNGLICARWIEDDAIQLYFARVRRQSIVEGLEQRIISRTIFATAFLRLDDGLLECWGNSNVAADNAIVLSQALGLSGFISRAMLPDEVGQFMAKIGARLVSDRFRDDEGRYDVIELVKKPGTRSLEDEPDYAERHLGKPHIRKVVEFSLPGSQDSFTMRITHQGGLQFMGYVPHSIIEYVFQQLREIKGF